jgi:hypothetical protein
MKLHAWLWSALVVACTAACIGPRVDGPVVSTNILPPGAVVASIADNVELLTQIELNDGIDDKSLAEAGGVIQRTTGKAAGTTVMYWNFGVAKMAGSFAVASVLYILADRDDNGRFTPRTDHPYLTDSIPGDSGYSAIRRVYYVPVSDSYAGEQLTTMNALEDALALGLVDEPMPAGTWLNMVVVPPGSRLEVGGGVAPIAATQVYARGYLVDTFTFGGARGVQPLRNGSIPVGQASLLQSGVATGSPPTLPTAFDTQPVFQYAIPAAPPTTSFNYTPLTTDLQVRLAPGIAPADVMDDATLYKRSMTGSISAYYVEKVATLSITTTVSNRPLQFVEGSP